MSDPRGPEGDPVNQTATGDPLMGLVFLALLVIAIAGGKPGRWKLYNFLIILACCALGLGLGSLPMLWGANAVISARLAASFLPIFGAAGAYVCMRQNTKRASKPGN